MNRQFSFKNAQQHNPSQNRNYPHNLPMPYTKRHQNSWADERVQAIKNKYEMKGKYTNRNNFQFNQNQYQASGRRIKTQKKCDDKTLQQLNRNMNYQPEINKQPRPWKQQQYYQKQQRASLKQSHQPKYYMLQNNKENKSTKQSYILQNHNFTDRSSFPFQIVNQNQLKPYIKREKTQINTHADRDLRLAKIVKNEKFIDSANKDRIRRSTYDPRIESIDKINEKINKALKSLDRKGQQSTSKALNDKEKRYTIGDIGKQVVSRELYRDWKQQQANIKIQQSQIIAKYQQIPERNWQNQLKYIKEVEDSGNYDSSKGESQKIDIVDGIRPLRQIQRSTNLEISNDKAWKSPQIFNDCKVNKKINEQMGKLDQRIIFLQDQKRKLNIHFKPFIFQKAQIKRLTTQINDKQNYGKKSIDKDGKKDYNKRNIDAKISHIKQERQSFIKKIKSSVQQRIDEKDKDKKDDFQRNDKMINLREQIDEINKDIENVNDFKFYDNERLRKKIGEQMENRRIKIETFQQNMCANRCEETECLIKSLTQQVKFDESFRSAKAWLKQQKYQNKFQIIEKCLKRKCILMTTDDIISLFTLQEDQNDPFFSLKQRDYTIDEVVEIYCSADNFWQKSIVNQWDICILFDLQKFQEKLGCKDKEFLTIQDLVRLLNNYSGSFYRKRDLFLIFFRLIENSNIPAFENQLPIKKLKQQLKKK